MGKHVLIKEKRRKALPVAATVALSGALAASPLGMTAMADPGPGGGGGGGHHHGGGGWNGGDDHGGGGDRYGDGHHGGGNDGGWDHDGGWGGDHIKGDKPSDKKPAPAPVAPAARVAPAAPAPPAAPAEPEKPVATTKQFPYESPEVENDLSGLQLDKNDGGTLLKVSQNSQTEDDAVGAIIGTGVALASVGGFAALLAAGRVRRGANP